MGESGKARDTLACHSQPLQQHRTGEASGCSAREEKDIVGGQAEAEAPRQKQKHPKKVISMMAGVTALTACLAGTSVQRTAIRHAVGNPSLYTCVCHGEKISRESRLAKTKHQMKGVLARRPRQKTSLGFNECHQQIFTKSKDKTAHVYHTEMDQGSVHKLLKLVAHSCAQGRYPAKVIDKD